MAFATVSIIGNFQSGQDVLAFIAQNGISGSYNSGTGVLTLTGNATIAQYQAALNSVTYHNSSNNPNTSNRTISFVVNDGTSNSAPVTKTLSITAVNSAPTLTATPANPSFTEGSGAVTLFSAASASTIESGQSFQSVTLTVTNLSDGVSEQLEVDGTSIALVSTMNPGTTVTNGLTYNVSLAAGTATVTLSNGTLNSTQLQTLVNFITYRNISPDFNSLAPRVVTITSLQDNGGTANGGVDTISLSLAAIVSMDAVPPAVLGITIASPPGNGASQVTFHVDFSKRVSNVDVTDFELSSTGSASGTISSVIHSANQADVTVTDLRGVGSLRLDLRATHNIVDRWNSFIYGGYTAGAIHNVLVSMAPPAPTIGTATASNGQVSVSFTPPGNNGGSPITGYTVTANPDGITASGPGTPLTVTGLTNGTTYTFTVTATNAVGTSTASGASNAATPKGNQTITFANPGAQNFGTRPTLTATSNSGLQVSFSSATTGVCTITSDGILTFVGTGSCTIEAHQSGNSAWNSATVSQTFTVNTVAPGAPTIGTAIAGNRQADVTFTAPASNGGVNITGYTVTSNPGGFTGTGASSPITVTGLINGTEYTFTVTAINEASLTGSASAASNAITPASPQTITFANPGAQNFGTSPTLTASSTSGLTVSFISSTTNVCTITSGGALTFLRASTCTIYANQAGDSSWFPAQVSQTFTVNPVTPGAPTNVAATAGNGQVSVAFTAPTNTGGVAITGYTVTTSPADVPPVMGDDSPIVITGLTNGTSYTFTAQATNEVGTSASSAPSEPVAPVLLEVESADGSVPGMAGVASATLSGGGATCTLTSESGFGEVTNVPPNTTSTPHGQFYFTATSCVGAVTVSLNYPEPLPEGVRFRKADPQRGWFDPQDAATSLDLTLSADRRTVTYSVTDNGLGDSAPDQLGVIVDPLVPVLVAAPGAPNPVAVPVLDVWKLALLSALAALMGVRLGRRRQAA
ncbi:hypothetical protein E9531_12990 [Lampropedia puyangensis]|uniref:Fibronectin type-III domain-containing protein n=2 Tax=Lampropedia puyangensis TaxID=1330072 RepID=A0A4S8EW77_9BURK|nr:hypothetical protein E9531_12990 [Lampropedia puyangensis]